MVHIKIRVTGKVQGVTFRASAKEKALELGLCGFVRNEADGSVYLEAEGHEEKITELTEWCKQGPPLATVTNATIVGGELKEFIKFEIRRY